MVATQSPLLNLPIAIVIFQDPNNQVHYRAYSSSQYVPNVDSSSVNHQAHQYNQFIAQIYNKLTLDLRNPLSNMTNYGELKEVNIRFLETPMSNRSGTCYFSAYNHPHCSYRTVHRQSPIYFTATQAQAYANLQPGLFHYQCEHEII